MKFFLEMSQYIYFIKQLSYMESFVLQQIGTIIAVNVGNSDLREILREYFGKNKISYTADYSNEIWGEVMQFLERDCKFIKDIELSSGIVTIYETDVVNEFLVRFEFDGGKNFVFWRNPSFKDYHIYLNYRNYKCALHDKQFNGTYDEYLRLNITFGPIGPVGRKIE